MSRSRSVVGDSKNWSALVKASANSHFGEIQPGDLERVGYVGTGGYAFVSLEKLAPKKQKMKWFTSKIDKMVSNAKRK